MQKENLVSVFGPYLSRLLVNQVEDCVEFWVPVNAISNGFPSQLACHNLQQIHLDGLLNEHHVVLRHCYNKLRRFY